MAKGKTTKRASRNGVALTAQEVLDVRDVKIERVDVPEWGGHIFVRSLRGDQLDAYDASFIDVKTGERNLANMRARLVVLAACDSDGTRIFADAQVDAVGAKNAKALDRVHDAAERLNKLTPAQLAEAAKN